MESPEELENSTGPSSNEIADESIVIPEDNITNVFSFANSNSDINDAEIVTDEAKFSEENSQENNVVVSHDLLRHDDLTDMSILPEDNVEVVKDSNIDNNIHDNVDNVVVDEDEGINPEGVIEIIDESNIVTTKSNEIINSKKISPRNENSEDKDNIENLQKQNEELHKKLEELLLYKWDSEVDLNHATHSEHQHLTFEKIIEHHDSVHNSISMKMDMDMDMDMIFDEDISRLLFDNNVMDGDDDIDISSLIKSHDGSNVNVVFEDEESIEEAIISKGRDISNEDKAMDGDAARRQSSSSVPVEDNTHVNTNSEKAIPQPSQQAPSTSPSTLTLTRSKSKKEKPSSIILKPKDSSNSNRIMTSKSASSLLPNSSNHKPQHIIKKQNSSSSKNKNTNVHESQSPSHNITNENIKSRPNSKNNIRLQNQSSVQDPVLTPDTAHPDPAPDQDPRPRNRDPDPDLYPGELLRPVYTEIIDNIYKHPVVVSILISSKTFNLKSLRFTYDPLCLLSSTDRDGTQPCTSTQPQPHAFITPEKIIVKVYDFIASKEAITSINLREQTANLYDLYQRHEDAACRFFMPASVDWWVKHVNLIAYIREKPNGVLAVSFDKRLIEKIVINGSKGITEPIRSPHEKKFSSVQVQFDRNSSPNKSLNRSLDSSSSSVPHRARSSPSPMSLSQNSVEGDDMKKSSRPNSRPSSRPNSNNSRSKPNANTNQRLSPITTIQKVSSSSSITTPHEKSVAFEENDNKNQDNINDIERRQDNEEGIIDEIFKQPLTPLVPVAKSPLIINPSSNNLRIHIPPHEVIARDAIKKAREHSSQSAEFRNRKLTPIEIRLIESPFAKVNKNTTTDPKMALLYKKAEHNEINPDFENATTASNHNRREALG